MTGRRLQAYTDSVCLRAQALEKEGGSAYIGFACGTIPDWAQNNPEYYAELRDLAEEAAVEAAVAAGGPVEIQYTITVIPHIPHGSGSQEE